MENGDNSGHHRSAWIVNVGWLMLYLGVMASVVFLVRQARDRAAATLETSQAKSEWTEWKDEAARQASGSGPVIRRTPATNEPPELVLLRDHFATSLSGLLLLTTAVFVTLMTMIRGVTRGPKFELTEDSDASPAGAPRDPD
jgi:hypothetical protein